MPNRLFLQLEIFDVKTEELIERRRFDYNNVEKRKEYLKLFHDTLKDPKLGMELIQVDAP